LCCWGGLAFLAEGHASVDWDGCLGGRCGMGGEQPHGDYCGRAADAGREQAPGAEAVTEEAYELVKGKVS